MQLKSYEASSVQEALEMIKRDLGEEAVVLSTSRRGKMVEVVAARDDKPPRFKQFPEVPSDCGTGAIQEALSVLFDLLGHQGKVVTDAWAPVYDHLVMRGVSKAAACRITDRMRRLDRLDVKATLAEIIPIYEFKKRVRVLIGPTGAGKTTTLAKLAAISSFTLGESTAIITTDTHRIAATDQARIYARIMNLPFAVAADGEAFKRAVNKFADREVIYVDTPGRSPRDQEALARLASIIGGGQEIETCLVLSLTSQLEHLLLSAKEYSILGPVSLIFTKVDECVNRGAICDVVENTGLPVSWWTTGQNVPEDIEKATTKGIAELILGGCTWIKQPC